jgi:hypothetical protein
MAAPLGTPFSGERLQPFPFIGVREKSNASRIATDDY